MKALVDTFLPALLNHLWQSTAFAAGAALLGLALRGYRPAVRFGIWSAASLKFLLPLALLAEIGGLARGMGGAAGAAPAQDASWQALQRFGTALAAPAGNIVSAGSTAQHGANAWVLPLIALWLCGVAAVLAVWLREWLRMRALVRGASPLDLGLPVRTLASPARVELGVFGVLRPTLLVPDSLPRSLSPEQMRAVLAHEMCHLRRRDNLWAALQTLVQAIFWFHPLVWWLGGRMLRDRELACDEAALRQCARADEYAAGLLTVCKLYAKAPVACMAGVSGSDLKARVLVIANRAFGRTLGPRMRWALVLCAALAIAVPLAAGALFARTRTAPDAQSSTTAGPLSEFDVVSLKPFHNNGRPWRRDAQFDPQRLYIEGMAPVEMINLAYSLNLNQLVGLPDWATFSDDHLYSITATTDKPTSKDRMLLMLREVLAKRFQLVLVESTTLRPVYDLVVAPGGPKLTPLKPGEDCDAAIKAFPQPKDITFLEERFDVCNVPDLVERLNIPNGLVDRPVIDKTRLTGKYAIVVFLRLGDVTPIKNGRKIGFREPMAEALKRQLGLMLVKDTGPYRLLKVAHIARPTFDN